jgi:hypothetical protein
MNSKQVYELAQALPEVSVKDHFGSDGFSANKRMFLTVRHEENRANLRLSPEEQRRFLSVDGDAFAQIENAWGRQGWTTVSLEYVDKSDFQKALQSAWDYSKTKTAKQTAKKKIKRKSR